MKRFVSYAQQSLEMGCGHNKSGHVVFNNCFQSLMGLLTGHTFVCIHVFNSQLYNNNQWASLLGLVQKGIKFFQLFRCCPMPF